MAEHLTSESRAGVWWLCDGCGFPYIGKPAQIVDIYDDIETYCDDCSEGEA